MLKRMFLCLVLTLSAGSLVSSCVPFIKSPFGGRPGCAVNTGAKSEQSAYGEVVIPGVQPDQYEYTADLEWPPAWSLYKESAAGLYGDIAAEHGRGNL